MRRLAAVLLWLLISVYPAFTQTAVVTRNVNLRPDPSTDQKPVVKLVPPTEVELIESSQTNGFYHVKAGNNQGWVWGKNVHIQPAVAGHPTQPQPPPGTGGLIEQNPVSAISSNWDKGTPEETIFHGDEAACAETGDGGDTDTNRLKNRQDVPPAYHYVTWDAINSTQYPQGAPRSRANWTASQLGKIIPVEGIPIAVEGYLYKVKVESSSPNASRGGESTNCHARLANDVDWHMPVTAHNGEGEAVSIIVETTPRLRQQHPNWTVQRLKPWTENIGSHTNLAFNGQPVRVRGWLMLDPEHQDMINSGLRSTLWEIHPITQIEVLQNGQWVDLDSLPQ